MKLNSREYTGGANTYQSLRTAQELANITTICINDSAKNVNYLNIGFQLQQIMNSGIPIDLKMQFSNLDKWCVHIELYIQCNQSGKNQLHIKINYAVTFAQIFKFLLSLHKICLYHQNRMYTTIFIIQNVMENLLKVTERRYSFHNCRYSQLYAKKVDLSIEAVNLYDNTQLHWPTFFPAYKMLCPIVFLWMKKVKNFLSN